MATVLIIDAEEEFANQLADALREEGIEPVVTGDGKVGLDLARINVPSAIVLCVELPRMSGYSICAKLKKDTALKNVPLIITSAEATPETFEHHKKLKTRAEEYLKKPFAPAQLVRVLRQYVQFPEGGGLLREDESALLSEELSMEDAAPAVLADDEVFSDEEASSMGRGGSGSGGAAQASQEMSAIDEMLSDLQRPANVRGSPRPAAMRAPAQQQHESFEAEDEVMTTVGFIPHPDAAHRSLLASEPTSRSGAVNLAGRPAEEDTHSADLELLMNEITELKAQLEAKGREAQAAKDAQAKAEREKALAEKMSMTASQLPSTASSGAREVVALKKELNVKEHELLELNDKLHAKQKEVLNLRDREAELEGQVVVLEEEKGAALQEKANAEARAELSDQERAEAEDKMRTAETRARDAEAKSVSSEQRATASEQKAQAAERKATLSEARAREAEQRATASEAKAQESGDRAHGAEARLAELERESTATIEELRARLGEANAHEAELDAALSAMTAEAAGLRETVADQEQALASAQEHIQTLRAANQQQTADITKLSNQLGGATAESESLRHQQALLQQQVEDGHQRAASLEGDVATARGEGEALRMTLQEMEGEREVAEGRIARAYQRIRDDEKIKGKAKKAIEIALALLQEAGYSPDDEAAPVDAGAAEGAVDQVRS